MNSWRPYPLLRLVFPFTAGIITEEFAGSTGQLIFLFPVFLSALLLLSQVLPVVLGHYRLRWVTGVVFNFFLFTAGYEIACCHRPANDPDFLGYHPGGLYVATIDEPPANNGAGIKAILAVKFRCCNGGWVRSSGSAIGYLKIKPGIPTLHYGDYLLLHAGFSQITDNSNPHAFNYSGYLKNKGISHRVFAEAYCWKLISLKPSGFIRQAAFRVRDRLLDILRDNHVEGREFAVTAALLLGYVDDLDSELRNDYAATGAMHILSVSGMHVGIIYIFLEFLLGFLNRNKSGRMLKALLLLVFIWFYAMVTGLSPCVLRSAAMLSLPIIGKSLNRSPNMYNILSASVIFILAMDPFLILDVSFQLSYLAVTGIIVLYKPIYDLYVTSAWLPDKIWSILAVSVAAQIATLPITLYTFHQFPNYFMLTNIFVVPLSSLIIYIGILVLVVGYVPVVAGISAKILVFLVWLLNSIIHFIEHLPYSAIRGIFISTREMLLLYLLVVAVYLFLTYRRVSFLYTVLGLAILLNLSLFDFKVHRLGSSRIIIFNVNREALYLFSCQDKAILLYGGGDQHEAISRKMNHDIAIAELHAQGIGCHRDFWLQARDRPTVLAKDFMPVMAFGNFILFSNCRIALLNLSIPKGFSTRLNVDFLILTGNPRIRIADAINIYHPGQIIIDATNSRFKTLQWMRDAAAKGVRCHAVTVNGAFQKEM